MKQRTGVRAIVRKGDQTLLLRRAGGKSPVAGKFEVPGGRINYGEQPEDALRRFLQKDAGLSINTVQLFDVLSYIDSDNGGVQYVLIVYLVSVGSSNISLSTRYDKAIWQSRSKIQHRDITESSRVLLGISEQKTITDEEGEDRLIIDDKKSTLDRYILYSDGGSRGNPGHSAAAYVIEKPDGEVIERGGYYLGITTSYQAEYHGLRIGLERALELGIKKLEYRLDSLMVVNQMKGIYTVKNRELWPINERILDLLTQFDEVEFTHVRREFNTIADGEVNRILDEHQAKQQNESTYN
ncbi:reverse transcriptase-like protein [Candidatus Saccharibacteria bacterium]|jgi:ribonuclease HI/ADP-ribose pyrophosphatase YjhB (NUDIX family)|nr:reverse transcriptase-like protein [Candidatus Saccharibacteria bacterium]